MNQINKPEQKKTYESKENKIETNMNEQTNKHE